MRVMLDTNVWISILLFPSERFQRMLTEITSKHQLVLSSFVLDEIFAVVERKFPGKKEAVDEFFIQSYL